MQCYDWRAVSTIVVLYTIYGYHIVECFYKYIHNDKNIYKLFCLNEFSLCIFQDKLLAKLDEHETDPNIISEDEEVRFAMFINFILIIKKLSKAAFEQLIP